MAIDLKKRLTSAGYVKRTPEEIKESIIEQIKSLNPNFNNLPNDVQSNLIDTGISKILEYENILEVMFNAYSMTGSNNFFFNQMGEELGLRMKNSYNAQVILRFKGLPGDIIPLHTKVKDSTGHYQFETQERKVISSTGEIDIIAYGESDSIVSEGQLVHLVTILSDGITVTNPQPSMQKIDKETFDQYRLRAQARLRSPRMGGRLYAESRLNSLEGVDPRLVAFYARDYTKEYDPLNPDITNDEDGQQEEETTPEALNSPIPQSVINVISLVNSGESRPSIITLQNYVDNKYEQNIPIQQNEFVHLYNKTGVNNYIYYKNRWYEVHFRLSSTASNITSLNTNKNIEVQDYPNLPINDTGGIWFCNRPGDKIGFYENRNSKYSCIFGPQIEINEDNKPVVKNFIRLIGIEPVIGGGDDYEVALALYQSFFETQNLLSNPSDKNKERRKVINLGLYNSKIPIRFTRPKLLELNLRLSISLLNKSMAALAIKKSTQEYLIKTINNLQVGKAITKNQLNQTLQPGLFDIDVKPEDIKTFEWQYAIGNFKDASDEEAEESEKVVWRDFDIDNKIPEILYDCYCVLVRYEVQVVG